MLPGLRVAYPSSFSIPRIIRLGELEPKAMREFLLRKRKEISFAFCSDF